VGWPAGNKRGHFGVVVPDGLDDPFDYLDEAAGGVTKIAG
jgi:hypothetical protein